MFKTGPTQSLFIIKSPAALKAFTALFTKGSSITSGVAADKAALPTPIIASPAAGATPSITPKKAAVASGL